MSVVGKVDRCLKTKAENGITMFDKIDVFLNKLASDQFQSDSSVESNVPEPAFSDCSSSVACSLSGLLMHRVASTESMSTIATASTAVANLECDVCDDSSLELTQQMGCHPIPSNMKRRPERFSISDEHSSSIAWGFIDPFPAPSVEISRSKSHVCDQSSYESSIGIICTPKRELGLKRDDRIENISSKIKNTSTIDAFLLPDETKFSMSSKLGRVGSCGELSQCSTDDNLCKLRRVGSREKIRKVWNEESSHDPVDETNDVEDELKQNNNVTRKRRKQLSPLRSLKNSQPADILVQPKKKSWLLPCDHPFKVIWDICTVLISILGSYIRHTNIRDRDYDKSKHFHLGLFIDLWFVIDILLNFITQYKSTDEHGNVVMLQDPMSVAARYLTSWFFIDVISLVPWELIYVKPLVEQQKRRNFFQKSFGRSKAVIRVTRILRGRHFKMFGRVARQTKTYANFGSAKLLNRIIRYAPKYWMFYKNMRSIILVRTMRQLNSLSKVGTNFYAFCKDDRPVEVDEPEITEDECQSTKRFMYGSQTLRRRKRMVVRMMKTQKARWVRSMSSDRDLTSVPEDQVFVDGSQEDYEDIIDTDTYYDDTDFR
mmetsp:Transcript_65618/g.77128  ORF Transcript_65618/g.77128 Transcript_65618/m.77128 type:complete len:601 (-) Transcript_65618:70-1872(-)